VVDFVEICNICARKAIIETAKRIITSDKVCRSYSDLNFGVTFWNTVYILDIIGISRVLYGTIQNCNIFLKYWCKIFLYFYCL